MTQRMKHFVVFLILFHLPIAYAQQVADTTFNPTLKNPAYAFEQGPVVYIDEGHHNFHTKDGRYRAFANLLQRDGYRVKAHRGAFTAKSLTNYKLLVISNALHAENRTNWTNPTHSAFSPAEIMHVANWVKQGGSLFLIADHMPMGGAAADLAKAFDFQFTNGFAFDSVRREPTVFSHDRGNLKANLITRGQTTEESVSEVVSFTGQAFKSPPEAEEIIGFNARFINLLPDTAWAFRPHTKQHNLKGWSQGAYRTFGRGKIVVFGEAAMFTTQLAGPDRIPVGMNSPMAPQNYQLLLNIIHYLDGILEE